MQNHIFTQDQIEQYRKKFFQKLKKNSQQWSLRELDIAWSIYPKAEHTLTSTEALVSNIQETGQGKQSNIDEHQIIETTNQKGVQDLSLEEHGDKHQTIEKTNQQGTQGLSLEEHGIQGITIIEDQFWMPRTGFSPMQLIYHLEEQWWKKRQKRELAKIDFKAEAGIGFYGRYLSGVGYFCVISFQHEGYFTMHRYDPQGKEELMLYPKDEGLFYDQFGTFLDYRTGLKWMIQSFKKTKEALTREVELGLVFGVRKGEPNTHRADREDDQLEHLFSKYDIDRFDTLEFIGSEEAQSYPFEEGTFEDWLDQSQIASIKTQELDIFVLANSEAFLDAIDDLSGMKQVSVQLLSAQKEGQDDILKLSKGKLSLEKSFSYLFLWAIHTAQSYHQAASAMLSESIEQLDDAVQIYEALEKDLGAYFSLKQEQDQLLITSKKNKKALSFPIFEWSSLGLFEGSNGINTLKKYLGISSNGELIEVKHSLKQCPICGSFATIQAMIRSKSIELRHQKYFFELGPVKGYFALVCDKHQVPIDWQKPDEVKKQYHEQPLQTLQIRGTKTFTTADHRALDGVTLLWGPELAGAFIHHSTRDLLLDLKHQGYAYAYTPNIVAIFPKMPDQNVNLLKTLLNQELPSLEYHRKSHAPLDWFIGKLERKIEE